MMWDGKKSVSQTILKMALEDIKAEQLKKYDLQFTISD